MSASHTRIREIFDEAAGLSVTERGAFVERMSDGDRQLAAAVFELLDALDTAGLLLNDDATIGGLTVARAKESAPSTLRSTRIGPYKLLDRIGEGGFGEVWAAEQQQPRRKVAIKVIRAGMDSPEVLARFEAERQALALMDHPCVAKVFDAGQTTAESGIGEGRSYFAMELVSGLPITDYCDSSRLRIRQRLDLFMATCDAVQHAHQRGVIHRDLKPSNILVALSDGTAVPKVIDFGIAKATSAVLTDRTLHTEIGKLIGTPEYMSPEQAGTSGLDVDTRSDVYSLGVVLYQLLTGTLPFDAKTLRGSGYDSLVRIVREMEPPAPSTRLSTIASEAVNQRDDSAPEQIASRRDTDMPSLQRELRGELDWIVMKCLEKDRSRRYDSARSLASDVGRYLAGEPVLAAPPSRMYRLKKSCRKHRVALGVTAAFCVLVIAGVAAITVQWQRAIRAGGRADVLNVYLKEVLTAADPEKSRGAKITVQEALDAAARRVDSRAMREEPLVEAEVRSTIGETYFALGLYSQAAVQYRIVVALLGQELGPSDPDTLRSCSKLAHALSWMTKYPEAVKLAEETLAAQRRALGPEHPDTQHTMLVLGQLLPWAEASRFAEAESLLQAVLEYRTRTLGADDIETARAMHVLGEAYTVGAYPERSEPLQREALRIHTRVLGPEHPDTLETEYGLACALVNSSQNADAEPVLRRLVEMRGRVQGPDHLGTLGAMAMLGSVLNSQGRYTEAETLLRANLEALQRTVGPDHSDNVTTRRYLATCMEGMGRHAEAEALLREALDVSMRRFGPEHADTTIRVMAALSRSLALQRKDAEAERIARHVIEIQRRQKPRPLVGELSKSIRSLISILERRGDTGEVAGLERELIGAALAEARSPNASPQNLDDAARQLLLATSPELKDPAQAVALAAEANRRTGSRNIRFLRTLARAHHQAGESAQAVSVQEKALLQLAPGAPNRALCEEELQEFKRGNGP